MLDQVFSQERLQSLTFIPRSLRQRKDKRAAPRRDIYMSIHYRVHHHEPYKEGMLINLSQTGALIFVPEKLGPKTTFTLTIAPDKATAGDPIRAIATVVREASHTDDGCYTYGCRFLSVNDPN